MRLVGRAVRRLPSRRSSVNAVRLQKMDPGSEVRRLLDSVRRERAVRREKVAFERLVIRLLERKMEDMSISKVPRNANSWTKVILLLKNERVRRLVRAENESASSREMEFKSKTS